jgi:Glycosyl hydrolases family 28/Bacterial Ig-like domain (group 3)
MHKKIVSLFFVLMTFVSSPAALSQDTRTVVDPVFPTGCLRVPATKFVVSTTALNRDPFNETASTPGYLGATGGTSFEPSSTESSYVAAESSDYTAVYTDGLAASPANHCVELAPSEGMYGFVMPTFSIPNGIWLVVDAGVTVFASRKAEDYDSGSGKCGTTFSGSSGISGGCKAWITSSNTTGSGIVGYGRLDARGWDTLSDRSPETSFYSNATQAYCNIPSHHGPINGSPDCTPTSNGSHSAYASPNAINLSAANDFTLYKITLTAGAGFQVKWSGVKGGKVTSGFTAVGFKLLVPFDISNTDGIDPTNNVTNFTIRDSYMSNGDDVFAIKSCDDNASCSTSGPVTNGTIQNLHKYSGLGISIGAATGSNVSNIDINTIFCDGPHGGGSLNNRADTCIKLKSPSDGGSGGVVNNIKFRNIYIQNEGAAFRVYPFYNCSGTAPKFTNLLFQNITLGSTPGSVTVQGFDSSHETTATFDNFVATSSFGTPQTGCGNSGDRNVKYTLGPGPVDETLISQLAASSGSSLVADNRAGNADTYSATAQPLVGELVLQTASAGNLQSLNTSAAASPFTLQAIVQPGSFLDTKESAPLPIGARIIFKDNGASIGTGSLGANGTLASLSLTDVAPGSHLYTATYPGDSNYPEYSFGAVTVTVAGGSGASTNPTLVSAYLVSAGSASTIVTGGTLQIKAYGTYSDGSMGALPDSHGNAVTAWNTSDHSVARVSTLGHATAVGMGSVNIEARIGDMIVSPMTVTVTDASALTAHAIPSNAASSGDLSASSHWIWSHDAATPGQAAGSSEYPIASPSLDGKSRAFYMAYSQKGGERFSLTFGHDTEATHFVYDAYVYIDDPTQLANLEMDVNQVMANGDTVIYAFQCSGYSKAWEYSTIANNSPHWHSTHLACSPKNWSAKTWHHVQIASHRSSTGVVTYDWVNLDGAYQDINNAVGNGAVALHWAAGALNLNFQLDGSSAFNGSVKMYADKLTIYYW